MFPTSRIQQTVDLAHRAVRLRVLRGEMSAKRAKRILNEALRQSEAMGLGWLRRIASESAEREMGVVNETFEELANDE